jgi:hypothetical protein
LTDDDNFAAPGTAIKVLFMANCPILSAMATKPDYYVVTIDSGVRPHPWRWEIRRHSSVMGVRLGAGGYQSRQAAEFAGTEALKRFFQALSKEQRK